MKLFNFMKRNKVGGKSMTLEEIKKAISELAEEDKSKLMEELAPAEEEVETPAEEAAETEETEEEESTETETPQTEEEHKATDKEMFQPLYDDMAKLKQELADLKMSIVKEKQEPKPAPDEKSEQLSRMTARYSSD